MASDDIYSVVSFFLYYSQIFGLNPVILSRKNGKSFFKPFWIGVIYTLLLAGVLCYSFQFSYGNLQMFMDNDLDIMFMHTCCKLVFGPMSVAVIFISSACSTRNLCNVINKLSEYDAVFQKHVTTMNYRWIKWIFMLCFLISLGVCSAYYYNEDVVLRKVSERGLSMYEFVYFFMSWCLFDIISWTLILNLFSFLYLVYKKFQQINVKLIWILKDYDQLQVDEDLRIFNITSTAKRIGTPHPNGGYDHERNESKDLNNIFATRILAITCLNVVLLCFSSFLLILMLVLGRRDNVLVTAVIWVCVRFFPTCVLIYPFCLVSNEADKTSSVVHEALSRAHEVNMRQELQIFSMQLNNRKLNFTCHGFFNLDGRTVLAVVGAAFAYLVVLLQFHITMSSIKDSGHSNNSRSYN